VWRRGVRRREVRSEKEEVRRRGQYAMLTFSRWPANSNVLFLYVVMTKRQPIS
jgi:hypothetical protein